MKPAARRRVEREIRKIMETDGDRCSICKKPLPENCRTFGGVTKIGTPSLVGDCCCALLHETILCGIYASAQDLGDLVGQKGGTGATLPPDQVEEAVGALQSVVADRAKVRGRIARQAGLDSEKVKIFYEASPWKSADAKWFEDHPTRSHRLRPAFDGEFEGADLGPIPAGHFLAVVVRQVEPGARVREPFAQSVLRKIPDEEATLHALFEVVARNGMQDSAIPSEEVDRIARSLERSQSGQSN